MPKADVNGKDGSIQEPSEVEPCMGSETPNKTNYFIKFRSDVCEKYNITHEIFYAGVILITLLVLLVIVVITLGAVFPRIPHSQQFPVCNSPACLRGASQIRDVMNGSATPCADLWNFACGGWLARHPLPKDKSIWNQKQEIVKQEAVKVRDLIPVLDSPLNVGSVEWKLKHLYEACMDVDNVNIDKDRPLTNIISELDEAELQMHFLDIFVKNWFTSLNNLKDLESGV